MPDKSRADHFIGKGTDLTFPMCNDCARYKGMAKCTAFGDATIPKDILVGDFDHRNPYPGDHGLQFVSKKTGGPKS